MGNLKQDFFQDCLNDIQQKLRKHVEPSDMQTQMCKRCKNHQCQRAGWVESEWKWRVENQQDWLLENPHFADLTHPHWITVQNQHQGDFIDNTAKVQAQMNRMDVAEMRGDWSMVSTDGKDEKSDTDAVDQALEALAVLKGKKPPKLPKLGGGLESPETPGKTHDVSVSEISANRRKMEEEKAKQARRDAAMATRMGVDVPEKRSEVPEELGEDSEELQPTASPQRPSQQPQQPFNPFGANTPMPNGGIMVTSGGAPIPSQKPKDAWAPRKKENVVKPGATVRMGKKK